MKGSYLRASIGLFAALAIAGGALAQAGEPAENEHHGKHHHHGDKGDDANQPGQPGTPGATDPAASGNNGAPTVSVASSLAPVAATPASRGLGAMSGGAVRTVGPLFTGLDVTVTTGDDDLRGDSLAWIAIQDPDGTSQQCDLKPTGSNSGFDNNSTLPLKCSLSTPLTSEQLKAAKFVLDYNGDAGATTPTAEDAAMSLSHSTDNWKVNGIRIRATGDGNTEQCVLNEAGAPLVEMRGDNRSFVLSGGC